MHKKYLKPLSAATAIICLICIIGCGNAAPDHDQWMTPTFWKGATLEEVKSGIKAGYKPDPTFSNGYTPLLMAALFNDSPEVINELIKAGASLKLAGGRMTPLMAAASNNKNPEIVKTLLKHGADVNAKGINGISAILMAAETSPNPQIFQILVDAGANLNDKLENGASVSDLALKNYKAGQEIREILSSKGKSIDTSSESAIEEFLSLCNSRGNIDRFKEMIRAGVSLNTPDNSGDLPILVVMRGENLDIAKLKLLLENGASPNVSNKYCDAPVLEFVKRVYIQNYTKFHRHFYGDRYNLSELFKELGFDKDKEIGKKLSYGGKFAQSDDPVRVNDSFFEVLGLLAHYKADFTFTNSEGNNALHIARMADAENRVIDYLLDRGCKPDNKNKSGDSPDEIMLCKCESQVALKNALNKAKLSIDLATPAGAELAFYLMAKSLTNSVVLDCIGEEAASFVNSKGENFLFAAVSNRNTQKATIERLLAAGIDINSTNRKSQTPLMYGILADNGNGTIDFLLKNGADQAAVDIEHRNILHYHAMNELAPFPDLQKADKNRINAIDSNGNTPIILALKHKQKESVFNFMYADADLVIKDASNKSALDYDDEAWVFEFCKSERAASQMIEKLRLIKPHFKSLMTPLVIFEMKCVANSKGEKEPNEDQAMKTEIMEYMERHNLFSSE